MRQLVEVIIDTFHDNHGLMPVIEGQGLVFHALCCHVYVGQGLYFCEQRVVTWGRFPLGRNEFNLRVEVRKERGYQVMEAVEDTQNDDQCHRSYGNSDHRNNGYDVNNVRTLLRKEVTTGNIKWEIHKKPHSTISPDTHPNPPKGRESLLEACL